MILKRVIYYNGFSFKDESLLIDEEGFIYEEDYRKNDNFYYKTAIKTDKKFMVSDKKLLTTEDVVYDIFGTEPEVIALTILQKQLNSSSKMCQNIQEVRKELYKLCSSVRSKISNTIEEERMYSNFNSGFIMSLGLMIIPFMHVFIKEAFFIFMLISLVTVFIRKDVVSISTFLVQLVCFGIMLSQGVEKMLNSDAILLANYIFLYLLQNLFLNKKIYKNL